MPIRLVRCPAPAGRAARHASRPATGGRPGVGMIPTSSAWGPSPPWDIGGPARRIPAAGLARCFSRAPPAVPRASRGYASPRDGAACGVHPLLL